MKIRAELHLGAHSSKVILAAKPEETLDHLALKLAAYAMFLPLEPIVEPSTNHPSLMGFDHKPDVMALNEAGEISVWIECGAVTVNKLNKVMRRLSQARIIVLKASLREAKQLRQFVVDELKQEGRVEIWTWPEGEFQKWMAALADKTEIFGEANEKSFNLVINQTACSVDLISI